MKATPAKHSTAERRKTGPSNHLTILRQHGRSYKLTRKSLTVHGKQMGDPGRAADCIFEAVTGTGMASDLTGKVARLVLGGDALDRMKESSDRFKHDLSLQEDSAASTAFE